jgi:hypothetical protein
MLGVMAMISVDGDDLVVTLLPNEQRWGLLSDLRVPLGSISAVEVVGNRQYVCVRRHQPAVKVVVDGQRYRTVLVGSDDAERIADEIRAASDR